MPPESDRSPQPAPRSNSEYSDILEFLSSIKEGDSRTNALGSPSRNSGPTDRESRNSDRFLLNHPLTRPMRTIDCHRQNQAPSFSPLLDKFDSLFCPWRKRQEKNDNEPLPKLIIQGKEENYPESKKGDTEDKYGDKKVADPYRWLEDTKSPETKSWVQKQTELTEKYLATIPERAKLLERLEKVYNYEQRSEIWKHGDSYYLWKQDGLKQQPELCVLDSFHAIPRTILDPNKLSADGHGIVKNVRLSEDGKFASFDFSDGGQDATRHVFFDLNSQKEIKELPKDIKLFGPESSSKLKCRMARSAPIVLLTMEWRKISLFTTMQKQKKMLM